MNNFQRDGAISNAHVGRAFESVALNFFAHQKIKLHPSLALPVGVGSDKKDHAFDLGSRTQKVIVECKSHTWTKGGNVPSAKLTVWNEAMYYFFASPPGYRKILFVLEDFSAKRNETLAQYYVRTYSHLIPAGVEVWEFNEVTKSANKVR